MDGDNRFSEKNSTRYGVLKGFKFLRRIMNKSLYKFYPNFNTVGTLPS